MKLDVDVTNLFLSTPEDYCDLFDWMKQKSGREVFKIVRGVQYINRRLQYEGIDKSFIISPRFAIGSKEYQF